MVQPKPDCSRDAPLRLNFTQAPLICHTRHDVAIDLREALHSHFGHSDFRPAQRPIVEAALAGHDLLAVMPTGAGKSLCFQLPAMVLGGLTIVVSPLISLMKDQVDELGRRGLPAGALHSAQPSEERRAVMHAARQGALRLLYVAPERINGGHFMEWLSGLAVTRFVVDEAHCVSEWGHDFRPDYRRLDRAAAACRRVDGQTGRPPILAFTATATPEVRDDIVAMLGLESPQVFVSGFDRPNIELRVRPVSGDKEKRLLLPQLVADKRALVYASTRKGAEDAAATLLSAGKAAAAYHAGLSDGERARVQDGFADGTITVVCATNAFGMGIDRPDVEVVVHRDIPGSLEAYYQEIGRVGRDGRPAVAILLWNYVDVKTREFLIERRADDGLGTEESGDEVEVEHRRTLDRAKLRRMVSYADTSACLRSTILRYFGDRDGGTECGGCSNCAARAAVSAEQLLLLRKILAGVARGGERWGRKKVAQMLTGHTSDLPDGLRDLSTTGLLANMEPGVVEKWIDALEGAGLLRSSPDVYRLLRLTPSGRDVMAGRTDAVSLVVPDMQMRPLRGAKASAAARGRTNRGGATSNVGTSDEPEPAQLRLLRDWRKGEAKRRAVPAYVVLHDSALRALVEVRPGSVGELLEIPGFGPKKAALYGDELIRLLASAERE
jgi:ATP-dependent DNA helicase RecQ